MTDQDLVQAVQDGRIDAPPIVQVMSTGTAAWTHWRTLFADELAPSPPNSPADACMECTGLCETCPVDGGEWPRRNQNEISTSEARGPPYAGSDAPPPLEAIARSAAHHAAWRTTSHNRHLYGDGGLFDELSPPSSGAGDRLEAT